MSTWRGRAEERAAQRRRDGLGRVLTTGWNRASVVRDYGSGNVVSFASNDYLGLATNADIGEAMAEAARHWGPGSGAAELLGGRTSAHAGVEERISQWLGYDRALYFPSGYQANVTAISALADRGETVIQDRLSHASLIDGARLAGAALRRYLHCDAHSADRLLEKGPCALLSTDALFSMDGDFAPLAALARRCSDHDTPFHVDEAHSTGIMGPAGRGALADAAVQADLVTVTFGKAFGIAGAVLVGCDALIELVLQFGRGYIYSTAPPPAVAAATQIAIEKVIAADERRADLARNITHFRAAAIDAGLDLLPATGSPIQSVAIRDANRAVNVAKRLACDGYFVPAIRPPTVPPKSSRMRLSITARHSREQMTGVCESLARAIAC